MTPRARIDVRAFACPITWVKTRVALERLAVGDLLEVWLGDGEPVASVPRTAIEDGHRLIALEPLADAAPPAFRLLLEKGATPPSPI
jgi:TusA-related sulfurtransferase